MVWQERDILHLGPNPMSRRATAIRGSWGCSALCTTEYIIFLGSLPRWKGVFVWDWLVGLGWVGFLILPKLCAQLEFNFGGRDTVFIRKDLPYVAYYHIVSKHLHSETEGMQLFWEQIAFQKLTSNNLADFATTWLPNTLSWKDTYSRNLTEKTEHKIMLIKQ